MVLAGRRDLGAEPAWQRDVHPRQCGELGRQAVRARRRGSQRWDGRRRNWPPPRPGRRSGPRPTAEPGPAFRTRRPWTWAGSSTRWRTRRPAAWRHVAGPAGLVAVGSTCTPQGPASRGMDDSGRREPGSESPTCRPGGRAQVRAATDSGTSRWGRDLRLEPVAILGLPGRDHALAPMAGHGGCSRRRRWATCDGDVDRRPVLRDGDERSGDRLGERRRRELDARRGEGGPSRCPGQRRRVALRRGNLTAVWLGRPRRPATLAPGPPMSERRKASAPPHPRL